MKKAPPFILLLLLTSMYHSHAITVVGWNFGTSCDLSASTVATGAIITMASRGSGIGGSNNCYTTGNCDGSGSTSMGGSHMQTNSESEAITAHDYFEFPVTAAANGTLTISSISFNQRITNEGPPNLAIHINGINQGTATTTISSSCSLVQVIFTGGPFVINPGETATVRIYAWDALSASGTIRIDDVEIEGDVLLPIELSAFSVTVTDRAAHLTWQTTSETGNDYFTIQHSTNGVQFDDLGSVPGAGYSLEPMDYSFTHSNPHHGINYYRLRQTDYDGEISFSKTKMIRLGENPNYAIYPNPARERLFLIIPRENRQAARVSVYNLFGQFYREFQLDPNQRQHPINIEDLSPGPYLLQISDGKGGTTHRFSKF